ncbi:MAG: hypothetical protein D6692_08565 [Planctomycetota bacterium]|nr:MAG: hypothetical protein D6692_08565 [Planctomycetota bacterium]
MSQYYSDACDRVSRESRINRLADYLYRKPVVVLTAGVCQVCGHKLPVAYRAVRVDEHGNTQWNEVPPGCEKAERLAARVASGEIFETLERTGWLILQKCACESLDEHVWREATALAEERRRSARAQFAADAGAAPLADKMRKPARPYKLYNQLT